MCRKHSHAKVEDIYLLIKKCLLENGVDILQPIMCYENAEFISNRIQTLIKNNIDSILEMSRESENNQDQVLFFEQYSKIWGKCIQLTECFTNMLIDLCSDVEIIADEAHIKDFVLAKLFGRGIRTYIEITILIKSGFPYGAASLTRNLFELMTIARFITKNDESVALEFYRETEIGLEFQKKDSYEWARKSGKFTQNENITFNRIREASGMEDLQYRRVYSFLCKFTHASPQTVNFDMFSVTDDIFLGASLYGVEVPGINATLFIRDIQLSFFSHYCKPELNTKELLCAEFATYLCDVFEKASDIRSSEHI